MRNLFKVKLPHFFKYRHNTDHVFCQKNNYNSILVDPNNIDLWNIRLRKVLNNSSVFKKIKKNSLITATKNTWLIRVSKIIKFNKY